MMELSKRILAAISAFCCAGLLISGTYAWTQSVSQTNEFIGGRGMVLHDDFDPAIGKKDVYVENAAGRHIFARVKLGEYMDLDSKEKPEGLDDMERYSEFFKDHFNPLMASPEDSSNTDSKGRRISSWFRWRMGGEKLYYPASAKGHEDVDTDPSPGVFSDAGFYSEDSGGPIQKTPFAEILAVDEYLATSADKSDPDSKLNFQGWIFDPASGDPYAYWSQPLGEPIAGTKASRATGLLLSGVDASIELDGRDYYYSIKVVAEAVDLADLPMWITPDPEHPGMGMPSVDQTGMQYALASEKMRGELANVIAPIAYPELKQGLAPDSGE
jgi:hypothetical protein